MPATIAELTQLEQLDLEFNFLSGKLDKHLCATADNKLETLYLRANGFTGPLNLSNCSRLQIVDIQVSRTLLAVAVPAALAAANQLRSAMCIASLTLTWQQ